VALFLDTSFTVAQGWTSDRTQYDSSGGFSNIQTGIGNFGGWTTTQGSKDLVTAAANNGLGGPGRGFRHWRGSGRNNNGGGMSFTFSPRNEVWLRFYMRYAPGFTWNGGQPHYTKDIYWQVGMQPFFVFGFSSGQLYTHVSVGSMNVTSTDTWSAINGGPTGDGQFHCYEQHLRIDTGTMQIWRDGALVLDRTGLALGTGTLSYFALGENQNDVLTSVDTYTDYDDIALSSVGRIGCL
jgi:hypothetical protein